MSDESKQLVLRTAQLMLAVAQFGLEKQQIIADKLAKIPPNATFAEINAFMEKLSSDEIAAARAEKGPN